MRMAHRYDYLFPIYYRTDSLDQVLALLGLSPKLGPIADWGLAMARKQLVVDTESSGIETDLLLRRWRFPVSGSFPEN